MVAARDVAAASAADSYYADFPSAPAVQAAQSASQPDLSQYPTTFGQYGSTAADPTPTTTTTSPVTGPGPFAPAPFPDTTTSQFPPPESPS